MNIQQENYSFLQILNTYIVWYVYIIYFGGKNIIKMTSRFILSFIALLGLAITTYAQGLRNEQHQYSLADLEYLLKQQRIVPYKFKFQSDDARSLNVIIRYFKSGELVKEYNLLNTSGKAMLQMSDAPRTHYFPRQNGAQPPQYSFYVHTPSDKDAFMHLNIGNLQTQIDFEQTSKISAKSSLALYDEKTPIKGRTPILAIYGWNQFYISCPEVETEDGIKHQYEMAAIVYVEPFEVDDVK